MLLSTKPRTAAVFILFGTLGFIGCDTGIGSTEGNGAPLAVITAAAELPAQAAASIPEQLVGTWNGGKSDRDSNVYYQFNPDGRYQMWTREGFMQNGTIGVRGELMQFQPQQGQPQTVTWQIVSDPLIGDILQLYTPEGGMSSFVRA
jgi:hypothetical protein